MHILFEETEHGFVPILNHSVECEGQYPMKVFTTNELYMYVRLNGLLNKHYSIDLTKTGNNDK